MNVLQIASSAQMEKIIDNVVMHATDLGLALLKAAFLVLVGRYIIKFINKAVRTLMEKRGIDPAIRSFLGSLLNILLIAMLVVSVVGVLGIQTTSFAALLASAGVAIGMALSGNLSNFAGGVILLIFRPFKVGDYISTATCSGEVKEVQIFHTILQMPDGIRVYIPNGVLSSGFINNYAVENRRLEWILSVDYGEDFEKVQPIVKEVLEQVIPTSQRPAESSQESIELHTLADSSVNIVVRVWVRGEDYWNIHFAFNKAIYARFNAEGISFPFPQLTIHRS